MIAINHKQTNRGEVTTLVTIASLVVMAIGIIIGNLATQQTTQSEAEAQSTGAYICRGTGNDPFCKVRIVKNTLKAIIDNNTFLIEGNICFAAQATSGTHKGKIWVSKVDSLGRSLASQDFTFHPGRDWPGACDAEGNLINNTHLNQPNSPNHFALRIPLSLFPVDRCPTVVLNYASVGGGSESYHYRNILAVRPENCGPTTTPTLTPAITPTLTPAITPTLTPAITPTLTPTLTVTPTPTACIFHSQLFIVEESPTPGGRRNLIGENFEVEVAGRRTIIPNGYLQSITNAGFPLPAPFGAVARGSRPPIKLLLTADQQNRWEIIPTGGKECRDVSFAPFQACPTDLGPQLDIMENITFDCYANFAFGWILKKKATSCFFHPKVALHFDNPADKPASFTPGEWGTINDRSLASLNKQFKDLNAEDLVDFDSAGRFGIRITVTPGAKCCTNELVKNPTDPGAQSRAYTVAPNRQTVTAESLASVYLKYPTDQYEVVRRDCDNGVNCIVPSEKDKNNVISNLPIYCNAEYEYRYWLKKKPSCPLLGANETNCKPRNLRIVKVEKDAVTVDWDAPLNCPAFTENNHRYWIDIVDTRDNKIVCSFSSGADSSAKCELNNVNHRERKVDKIINQFENNVAYAANIYTQNGQPGCINGNSIRFNRTQPPSPPPGDKFTYQLDIYDVVRKDVDLKTDDVICWAAGTTDRNPNADVDRSDNLKAVGNSQYRSGGEYGRRTYSCDRSRVKGNVSSMIVRYRNDWTQNIEVAWQTNRCKGIQLTSNGLAICNDVFGRQLDAEPEQFKKTILRPGQTYECTWDLTTARGRTGEASCSVSDSSPTGSPAFGACCTDAAGNKDNSKCPSDEECKVPNGSCPGGEKGYSCWKKDLGVAKKCVGAFCVYQGCQAGENCRDQCTSNNACQALATNKFYISGTFNVTNNSSKVIKALEITVCDLENSLNCISETQNIYLAPGQETTINHRLNSIKDKITAKKYTVSASIVNEDNSKVALTPQIAEINNPLIYNVMVNQNDQLSTEVATERQLADCDKDGIPTAKDLAFMFANYGSDKCDTDQSGSINALDISILIKWLGIEPD